MIARRKADQFMKRLVTRRSIRRYRSAPVSQELLDQILTAAIWAPSAHNRQPWRFAVIRGASTKRRLAQAMGQRLREDLAADNVPQEYIEKDADRSFQRLTGAPVLVLLSMTMVDMDTYPDDFRQQNEWVMAAQSTAMAGQNLLLAAHALGLGACWMCAPLFCPDVVKSTLHLPDDWEPQGLITLGYPAESREKSRHSLASRTLYVD